MFDERKLRAEPVEWKPQKSDTPHFSGLFLLLSVIVLLFAAFA